MTLEWETIVKEYKIDTDSYMAVVNYDEKKKWTWIIAKKMGGEVGAQGYSPDLDLTKRMALSVLTAILTPVSATTI